MNPNSQKAKLIARLQTYVPLYDWPLLDELAESGGPEGDGWNAGIEAAAKLVDEKHDSCEPWLTGDDVRALKRPEAGAERASLPGGWDAATWGAWLRDRGSSFDPHVQGPLFNALADWIERSYATEDGGKNG